MKGEVRIEQTFDDDAVFESGREVVLAGPHTRQSVQIEFVRKQHGRCIAKFRGIDSIADVEKFIGYELTIPADEVPELEEGWFYTFDLRGCEVVTNAGDLVGTVSDVLDAGGSEILKVELNGVETLIPFAETYVVRIDVENRRIEVDLPEDLRNLNK